MRARPWRAKRAIRLHSFTTAKQARQALGDTVRLVSLLAAAKQAAQVEAQEGTCLLALEALDQPLHTQHAGAWRTHGAARAAAPPLPTSLPHAGHSLTPTAWCVPPDCLPSPAHKQPGLTSNRESARRAARSGSAWICRQSAYPSSRQPAARHSTGSERCLRAGLCATPAPPSTRHATTRGLRTACPCWRPPHAASDRHAAVLRLLPPPPAPRVPAPDGYGLLNVHAARVPPRRNELRPKSTRHSLARATRPERASPSAEWQQAMLYSAVMRSRSLAARGLSLRTTAHTHAGRRVSSLEGRPSQRRPGTTGGCRWLPPGPVQSLSGPADGAASPLLCLSAARWRGWVCRRTWSLRTAGPVATRAAHLKRLMPVPGRLRARSKRLRASDHLRRRQAWPPCLLLPLRIPGATCARILAGRQARSPLGACEAQPGGDGLLRGGGLVVVQVGGRLARRTLRLN